MISHEKKSWEVLAEQASREQDSDKLRLLIAQLNSALDEKYAPRLRLRTAA
jgi:hypothetical protein